VGYERIKSEYAGPKNGGGAWMTGAEAKQSAKTIAAKSTSGARWQSDCVAPEASLADELIADRRTEVRIEEGAEVERRGEG
jgi:hypothetical protein